MPRGSNRLSKDEVIRRFKVVHGDYYDYSLVDYKSMHEDVCIICPIHGPFWQPPHSHIKGHGCKECGIEKSHATRRLTKEEFLLKVQKNPLCKDYCFENMGDYVNNHTNINVFCNIHQKYFQIMPTSLLSGQGCYDCGRDRIRDALMSTKEQFILKARQIHGWKYDYSKVDYKGTEIEVCIICPIHGEFWMKPKYHLRGHGCRECSGQLPLTTERFKRKARIVHGDRYGYEKVDCKGKESIVTIICPIHGDFEQMAGTHLNGAGCQKCKESHGERIISLWLDAHNIIYEQQYRIIPTQVLFGRNLFKVDFYLPDYDTIIEFHGRQHYEVVTGWKMTEEQLAEQQDRDRRLREHCKQHGITLIEIPYTRIKEIDKILDKKIGKSK